MLLPAALLLVAASAASVAAAGYTRHAGQIPTVRGGYFASLSAGGVRRHVRGALHGQRYGLPGLHHHAWRRPLLALPAHSQVTYP